jgi:hypothetical protein
VAVIDQWRQCLSTVSNIEEPQEQRKSIPRYHATNFEELPVFPGFQEISSTSFTAAGLHKTVGSTMIPPLVPDRTAQIDNRQQNLSLTDLHLSASSSRSLDLRPNAPSTSPLPDTTLSDSHISPDNTQVIPMIVQPDIESYTYAQESLVFDRVLSPGTLDSMIQAFGDTTSWPPSASTVPLEMHFDTCLSNFL